MHFIMFVLSFERLFSEIDAEFVSRIRDLNIDDSVM